MHSITVGSIVLQSVSGAGCTGASCGVVSSSGLYTAPPKIPTPAHVSVTATSVADTTKSATASVTIIAGVSVTVTPVNDLAAQFLPGMINLPFSGDISARLVSLVDALLGAAVGASFIYGAGAIYLRWRGSEGMGFGDVKLMAMVGAFLGVKLTVFTIFTASLAGSFFGVGTVLVVWVKRTHRFMKRRRK